MLSLTPGGQWVKTNMLEFSDFFFLRCGHLVDISFLPLTTGFRIHFLSKSSPGQVCPMMYFP